MTADLPPVVFLDGNVLAKPVTRTLLIAGAYASGYVTRWSELAEAQADRHLGPRKLPVSELRTRLGMELSPTGARARRFRSTAESDRQILADAEAAGAVHLVTEDVDDFGLTDLVEAGISAVNPDLFMAVRLTGRAYEQAIRGLILNRQRPPNTATAMHAAIAKQHPRLFRAHAEVFGPVDPAEPTHNEPAVVFRGGRCVVCDSVVEPDTLAEGECPDHRQEAAPGRS